MENENLEKDIQAIESEKKAFLEGKDVDSSEDEEREVEETEFSLTSEEIDEWLEKLIELRENKSSIELDVDNETSLKINYEESEDSESDELKSDEVIEKDE